MATETKKTYCRLCTASCAIDVDVEGGRAVAVRGTKADPLSGGYTGHSQFKGPVCAASNST